MNSHFDFNTFANTPEEPHSGLESRIPPKQLGPRYSNYQESESQENRYSSESEDQASSHHKNLSIPELKKQMEQALKPNQNQFANPTHHNHSNSNHNHKKLSPQQPRRTSPDKSSMRPDKSYSKSKSKQHEASKVIKKQQFGKYPLDISLIKSDISMISTDLNLGDLPKNLIDLEFNVTDDILTLREEKITLMEEYNRCLQNRYRIQREVHRLKKEKESRRSSGLENILEEEKQSRFPSGNITQKNFNGHQKSKQKQSSERRNIIIETSCENDYELEEIESEITAIRHQTLQVEKQLMGLQEKTQKIEEQRFETFFPHQNDNKWAARPNRNQELAQLRNIKNQLLMKLGNSEPDPKIREYFLQLVEKNRQLHAKADQFLANKNSAFHNKPNPQAIERLRQLKMQIQEEQLAKQLFFEDLKRFKSEMATLKQENDRLRN